MAATGGVLAVAGGVVGAVVAAVGGIIALIGEIVGWIGGSRPNCDGAVAVSPALTFSGAQLETLITTPVPNPPQNFTQFTTTFENSHLSQASADGCWTPNTDITWSILLSKLDRFGPTPPPPPTSTMMLAASNAPHDWEGTWGDGHFVEDSRIQCIVQSSGNGVSGATPANRVNSYVETPEFPELVDGPLCGQVLSDVAVQDPS